MNRKIKIDVTADDIEDGIPFAINACPVALACRRAGLECVYAYGAYVAYGPFYTTRENPRSRASLPKIAQQFIEYFDRGDGGEPFSFELEVHA